ncbi:probable phosphoglycerate mutase [Streptomyces sp. TverLS-915]|uniref:histidine phosphatase family protein n=1 Tax=Streptomyces sp. TverLS-915 TaxID=1839763 RepID=UPI00081DC7E5|nr:probable phosphoglycerate mutase [Streptomyces sp. TverLS-915]
MSAGGAASGDRTAAASPPPDLGPPTTFVLLRHGATALTAHGRFSGSGAREDPPLADAGRAQAAAVATYLRGTPVDTVVSSPLRRCRETAAALGLPYAVEEDLRETDFGTWEGLTFTEARAQDPDAFAAWLAVPGAAPPGGESFADVAVRVAAARDRLLAAHRGRTVLLVSHVTPLKTLLRLALGAPHTALFRMDLAPASLSALAVWGDGNTTVRYLNNTAHLPPG